MSHVSEGALHAYLDGALDEFPEPEAERIRVHLDACSVCSARLEVERRVRSDAHAMLGLAAPVVDVPSFEELRAYVQRTAKERRGTNRMQRIGWAASVVLALGAGWMVRDGQLQSRAMDIGSDLAPAARPATEGRVVLESSLEASPERARPNADAAFSTPRDAVSAAIRLDEESTVPNAALEQGVGGRLESRPAPTVAPSEPLSSDVLVSRATESDADPAKVSGAIADAQTPLATDSNAAAQQIMARRRQERPADELGALYEREVVAVDAAAMVAALEDSVMDPPVAALPVDEGFGAVAGNALVDTVVLAERAGAEQRPRLLASTMEIDAAGGGHSADRDVGGRTLVMEFEEATDESVTEPLLSVPGHQVVDVTNLGDGSTAWGARVRQRMDDGRIFEVFHLEPGIDPSILPPMDAGVGEAVTETAYGWVLVRGALLDGELRELLGRLFPETPSGSSPSPDAP